MPLNLVLASPAADDRQVRDFKGKAFLVQRSTCAFSVSPVISGLVYVLLFGSSSLLRPWLRARHRHPCLPCRASVLTVFVTFPFVARELIPADAGARNWRRGSGAISLGVRLADLLVPSDAPASKMGTALRRALVQCARHGRSSARYRSVSGHIRGLTNTMPLHVEILCNEYNAVGAFAVASLLAGPGAERYSF